MPTDQTKPPGRRLIRWRWTRADKPPRLGEILLKRRVITPDQLEHAIREQSISGQRLGEVLIANGFATRVQVSAALRRQHKYLASIAVVALQVSTTAFAGSLTPTPSKKSAHGSVAAAQLADHESNSRLAFLDKYANTGPGGKRHLRIRSPGSATDASQAAREREPEAAPRAEPVASTTGQSAGSADMLAHASVAARQMTGHQSNGTLPFLTKYAGEGRSAKRAKRKRAAKKVAENTNTAAPNTERKAKTAATTLIIPDEVANLKLPHALRVKVAQYLPDIKQASERFGVPLSLILGVMHTESHFNHQASSSMNAQGLMQVVPKFAGREAYAMVYHRKGTPTLAQLRDPATNILLGTAYLKRLEDLYFRDITDRQVRQATVIAAYNVGPTKLRGIFDTHGTPRSLERLQQLLALHTPRETQAYLVKVRRRSQLYAGIRGDTAIQVARAPSSEPPSS